MHMYTLVPVETGLESTDRQQQRGWDDSYTLYMFMNPVMTCNPQKYRDVSHHISVNIEY